MRPWAKMIATAAAAITALIPSLSHSQTDEIQVYTGEINAPREFSVMLHNNFTFKGRKQAGFDGGVIPNRTLNGVPEFAYGVNEWFEMGAYLPLYSIGHGDAFIDGAKLRALFVAPHAEGRLFFYGVNFELSFNSHHWDTSRYSSEVRPILGVHLGHFDAIVNPIVDVPLSKGFVSFAPAVRIAYNFSENLALAVEHYADYGALTHVSPTREQDHALFAVVNYSARLGDVEFGIGHGLTSAADRLVVKLMLSRTF
jgi:hypothetical protein